jgi:hypothetical protein
MVSTLLVLWPFHVPGWHHAKQWLGFDGSNLIDQV